MVTYSRDEIISASEMARGFSAMLKELTEHTKERLAISRNNKLEAVVLSIEEYERLQEAYDLLEQMDIHRTIEARKASKIVSLEASAKRHGIDLDAL
jgi:prevent-host-death family protein